MRAAALLSSSAAILMALTACQQPSRHIPGAQPQTSTTVPRATGTSGGPTVCHGVSDCHLVLLADVDGDGVPDQVAVIGHPLDQTDGGPSWPDGAKPTLRVQVGGNVLTYRVPLAGPLFAPLVRGAAAVDGVPGDEVLVGNLDGAHGSSQTVVTLRDGQLVPLASPDPYTGEPGAVGSWGADSSIRSYLGWHCLPGARVTEYAAEGLDTPKGGLDYTLTHRTWRWTSSGWKPTGEEVTSAHHPASDVSDAYTDWTACGTFARDPSG
jgi:hypothetical protein